MPKRLFILCIFLGFLAVLSYVGPAMAHPHVFVNTTLNVIFDQKGLSAIKVQWLFDEMFSSMITDEFDKDHNGALSPAEVKAIRQNAFANTAQFSYFTHIKIDGKPFKIKWVKDFSAKIQEFNLVYEFVIPCHIKAAKSPKKLSIGVFDPSYYADVGLAAPDPVRLKPGSNIKAAYSIGRDKENPIYFGMVNPWLIQIGFERKS